MTPDDHRSVLFGGRVRLANGLDGGDLLPIRIQRYRRILMEHTKVWRGRGSQGERGQKNGEHYIHLLGAAGSRMEAME